MSGIPGDQLADLLVLHGESAYPTVVLPPIDAPGVTVEPVFDSLVAPDAAVADVVCAGVRLDDCATVGPSGAATAQRDLDLWFGVLAYG